jgi:methionyl-tRNA formyltransferase
VRVLFWGTPEFAAPALRALVGEGFDVVGVVTQPDRPRGRSRSVLAAPPVKEIALAEGIPVLQPERPRGEEFIAALAELRPDISVVVAYGHILRREVIELPPLGTVNVHASLLPALRGADPIRAAIRRGLSETGVTIMQMVEQLDAGPMLLQMRTPVTDETTYGELSMRLSELGALALVEALALISVGESRAEPQDESLASFAPKAVRGDARIDWSADCVTVSRVIRAHDPVPGAFTSLRDAEVKLFAVRSLEGGSGTPGDNSTPGEILAVGDTLTIACGGGVIGVAEVQPAGKRRITVAEWARGRGAATGDVFGA